MRSKGPISLDRKLSFAHQFSSCWGEGDHWDHPSASETSFVSSEMDEAREPERAASQKGSHWGVSQSRQPAQQPCRLVIKKHSPPDRVVVGLSQRACCGPRSFDDTKFEGIDPPCPDILTRGNHHKADAVRAEPLSTYVGSEPQENCVFCFVLFSSEVL